MKDKQLEAFGLGMITGMVIMAFIALLALDHAMKAIGW